MRIWVSLLGLLACAPVFNQTVGEITGVRRLQFSLKLVF
jgi:hypothetical protein